MTREDVDALTLDDHLFDAPDRTTLHRVRGDSMKDANIVEGDMVVVEHNSPTKPGDIVLAVVDNELTVKTLALDEAGQYFLQAANPAYEPIRPATSLELLGVAREAFPTNGRPPSRQQASSSRRHDLYI